MSAKTLEGRRIVVTRPAGQAESLCAAIEARGGAAVRFPLLAISPAADDGELEAAVQSLDDFDLAFFVSPNAVHHALEFILARRAWPPALAVATVGKGSERVLHERGFAHVIAPQSGFDSESVLALPEFSERTVSGRRVVIFRGDGGRELLGDTLRQRGARVDHVCCYRRHCPDIDTRPLLDMARRGELAAITLTSSEGVGHLATLLGGDGLDLIRTLPVFASHPRIVAGARTAGLAHVIETAPGDAGILAGLAHYFDV